MKKLVYFSLVAVLLFVNTPQVDAISEDDLEAINLGTPVYYGGEVESSRGCYEESSVDSLPESVPETWREILPEAATEYEIDVGVLAVVLYVENREFPDPDTDWAVSDGGAKGPFQFLDGTWDSYGVDGDGDGSVDVNNIEDASYGAANYLASLGAHTELSLGSLDQDFSEASADTDTVAWVLKSYNAGPNTYRDSSGSWYRSAGDWGSDKQNEINTYIEMGLDKYQELAGTGSSLSDEEGCGGLGITDDLTFPLITTQQEVRRGVEGATWCYESTSNCHGAGAADEYNAADIHVPTGTPVVAAVGGTVVMVNNGSSSLSLRIDGEDGLHYHYQHLTINSERVSEGDSVQEGDILGEVGDRTAAFNTAPHLHFDVAPERVGIDRDCVEAGNCEEEKALMIDSQPELVEAFNELPEG